MSKAFCIKTYRNALNQMNKDFEFHKKDLDTQKRIDLLSQNKLAELRTKNQTKTKILSRNIERNKQFQEERIQQIQKRLNRNNTLITQTFSNKTLPITGTCSPKLEHTLYILTQHKNELERLRKSYENITYKKIAVYTQRRGVHFEQRQKKFNTHNKIVNEKMNKHIAIKSIGTGALKNELDLQEANRLNSHNKYLHDKYNSIISYARSRNLHGSEVRMRKRKVIEQSENEINKVVKDVIGSSYEDYIPPNYFNLSQQQLKRIDRRKEVKERKDEMNKEEARKKVEDDSKILNNELNKFYKIMTREQHNKIKRENILFQTIQQQEQEDYNLERTHRKLENLKNKSIYKSIN
jgi:hypothetical protein